MKKSAEEKSKELAELVEFCRILNEFMFDYDPVLLEQSRRSLDRTLASASIPNKTAAFRMAYRDGVEAAKDFGPDKRARLDRVLRERLGYGLDQAELKVNNRAAKILKRGKIRNADEYRALEVWSSMLTEETPDAPEIAAIQDLLATVHKPLSD